MDAGVDHQSAGAQHLVVEAAKVGSVRVIDTHVDSERLRVQAPALGEGRPVAVDAEQRQIRQLGLQRRLQVMARHGLMQRQRVHAIPRSRGQVVGVDEEGAWPRALFNRSLV